MNAQKQTKKKTTYLDFASSTPIDPGVLAVLMKASKSLYANPSALHGLGATAHRALEEARSQIAASLGAHSDEIIFCSGGTESDNMAVLGTVRAFQKKYPSVRPHIIISAIEHAAVKSASEELAVTGIDLSILPVDQDGVVDVKNLRKLIRPETILVSVMLANNEIGTIEPLQEIAKEVRHARRHKDAQALIGAQYPLLHTDASQALNYIQISVEKMGIDLLTINSGKIYGPKGVGALYVKRRTPIAPIMFGGDQEKGLRPGTESLPAIMAFAEALRITEKVRAKETIRLTKLRDYCISKLEKLPCNIRINGGMKDRLPNNINITILGYQSEMLVVYLDAQGFCVSAKSACKSTDPENSHVIEALGYENPDSESGSIRISLGRGTSKLEIDSFLKALVHVLQLLK